MAVHSHSFCGSARISSVVVGTCWFGFCEIPADHHLRWALFKSRAFLTYYIRQSIMVGLIPVPGYWYFKFNVPFWHIISDHQSWRVLFQSWVIDTSTSSWFNTPKRLCINYDWLDTVQHGQKQSFYLNIILCANISLLIFWHRFRLPQSKPIQRKRGRSI